MGNNNWIQYVKQVQNQHNCSYKEALKIASKTYSKKNGSGIKDIGRAFDKFGKTMTRGFNKVGEKLNPFNNKKFQKAGAKMGEITNNELLPAVQQVGTEVYKKGLQILDPFSMGMASSVGNALYNKMAKKYIRQPKNSVLKGITDVAKVGVKVSK